MTDALGHVTTYQYDKAGHVIKTIFNDGSTISDTFDNLGRIQGGTDSRGRSS